MLWMPEKTMLIECLEANVSSLGERFSSGGNRGGELSECCNRSLDTRPGSIS